MVEVKSLYFTYPTFDKVLDKISFTVPDGQIVAILGVNGAGKTTLLKLLSGLMNMDEGIGSILIDGKTPLENSGEITLISEVGTYLKDLTPKEYGLFLGDFFPKFDMPFYEKLIAFFQLPEHPMKKMSKGQRAKAEVAAGMAKRTKYIIMDEPFVGKDMFTRQDFMQALAGTLTGEETIFITTHEIDEIDNFVDRAIVLKDKKIAADVMIDELRLEGKTLEDVMRETAGYQPDGLISLLAKE